MTKQKTIAQRLDETMAKDYGEDYIGKHNDINALKTEQVQALHKSQQEALEELNEAFAALLNSYRCLVHPTFDEVVRADNSYHAFCGAFNLERKAHM